jgi:hypothetical protein
VFFHDFRSHNLNWKSSGTPGWRKLRSQLAKTPSILVASGAVVGRASLDLATLGLKVVLELEIVSME